eukprot:2856375-Prymnesium_polylepis.1
MAAVHSGEVKPGKSMTVLVEKTLSAARYLVDRPEEFVRSALVFDMLPVTRTTRPPVVTFPPGSVWIIVGMAIRLSVLQFASSGFIPGVATWYFDLVRGRVRSALSRHPPPSPPGCAIVLGKLLPRNITLVDYVGGKRVGHGWSERGTLGHMGAKWPLRLPPT